MKKGFKCDFGGGLVDEEPILNFVVDLDENTAVQITPLVRTGNNQYGQGEICEAKREQIMQAVNKLVKEKKGAATK